MKYSKILAALLVTLASLPTLAGNGPFSLHRSLNADAVQASPVRDQAMVSPFQDDAGSLSDSASYFYLVADATTEGASLQMTKDRTNDRVVISFNDGTATPALFDVPFQVNAIDGGDQTAPAVSQSATGGSVMIWQGDDGDGVGIFGRVFAADGSAVTGQFQINSTTVGDQSDPQLEVNADGSFVVVWQGSDADRLGVYFQRFAADGTPLGVETLVNQMETGDQRNAQVMVAANGSFVVLWEGEDADGRGIFARSFDANGQPMTLEFPCNSSEAGEQESPSGAMAADGRFVVTWQTHNGSDQGVRAQLYDANIAPVGLELTVNTSVTSQQQIPVAAMADTGAFTIVWQGIDSGGDGIAARSYDANGVALLATEVVVNTEQSGLQESPHVAMDSTGGSLVVWRDNSSKEIRGRRFDAAGQPHADDFRVSDLNASKPEAPAASLAGDGSSYIVLYEAADGSGRGIFAVWVPLQ